MPDNKNISSPVLVAGLGIISAIGNNLRENLLSLENEIAGIGKMHYLSSAWQNEIPVAEVKMDNHELESISAMRKGTSRTALLSMVAAREALQDAGIQSSPSIRSGFISANTVGGMDQTEDFFVQFLHNPQNGRLHQVVNHECGAVTRLVADALGINHYISTISTACSSSANAIFHAARLIKHGYLDMAVAGGTDAITKFTLNGFNALMILDRNPCKPFDENREGLNLGEGAGYLVLISEKLAATLNAPVYCRLSGYCNRNDAYHQTASSPDGRGSFLAMEGALKKSGLQPAAIDYINLHGTGTHNNDLAEGTAIQRLFSPRFPKVSSTKSFTGHTLGASGGIEAVFSALSIKHGIVYPNLRLTDPIKDFSFAVETKFQANLDIRHVLSNSFGFGGNCSSLIFSK